MAAQTFTIKQGDTGPDLVATLLGADFQPQDLTGCTVKFNMKKGSVITIDHGAAVAVGDPVLGVAKYPWQPGDTANAGDFDGEVEVTTPSGEIITFPNDSNFRVIIKQQVA